jgi:hypothetical protein
VTHWFAIYLIIGAALFLLGDPAGGRTIARSQWAAVLFTVAATIVGWPLFWGYVIWSVARRPRS